MTNKEKIFVSAVIYVHNAGERIGKFLECIVDVLEDNFEHSEIILCNDCSSDNSAEIIKQTSNRARTTNISIINMSYFHGLELAMNAGINFAIGDFVFEFDNTNLDFDKTEIVKIYKKSLEGFDIVSASPLKKLKRSSDLFYKVFSKNTDNRFELKTESFRVLSRRAINRISSMNKTIPYRKVLYATCGLKTYNISYNVLDNNVYVKDGEENKYRINLAIDALILFTDVGYTFAKNMTLAMIVITVLAAVYSTCVYLIGNPVEGWTTTILFLSFCFFGMFGILTIVIKYLQIIVNLG